MTTTYVNWGESRVKLTWEKNSVLPPYDLITSVHGFCFREDQLLLIDLIDRRWDFPGGHIEPEETPEECFKREALEEGYIEGECELLGYITGGNIQYQDPDEEIEEIAWKNSDEISKIIHTYPEDQIIIENLISNYEGN